MSPKDPLVPFGDDLLDEIRKEGAGAVTVRMEKRRYGKDVTIVEGLPRDIDLADLAKTLKRRLATGGSAKDDHIELQGDQVARVRAALSELGYTIA